MEVVEPLLAAGATVDAEDEDGREPRRSGHRRNGKRKAPTGPKKSLKGITRCWADHRREELVWVSHGLTNLKTLHGTDVFVYIAYSNCMEFWERSP